MTRIGLTCVGLTLCFGILSSDAATTQLLRREASAFRSGTLERSALDPAGRIVIRDGAQSLSAPAAPVIWDLIEVSDVFYAGGSEGTGVWRIPPQGDAEPIPVPANDPDVFALASSGKGELFVASGPRGAVYRLDPATRSYHELFRPDADYIWDLASHADGSLWIATGIPARVYRLDLKGKRAPELIYESDEQHIRTLTVLRDGRVLVGTAGSGWVVDVGLGHKPFVVLDTDRAEVVAIAEDDARAIWVAVAGGPASIATNSNSAPRPRAEAAGAAEVVTVVAEGGENRSEARDDARERSAPRAPEPATGGSLLRLTVGGEPTVLFNDDKATPFDLQLRPDGTALLATAAPARIEWIDAHGRKGQWEVREASRAATALVQGRVGLIAAFSNPAAIVRYSATATDPARYISDVLDAKTRAVWGRVRLQLDLPRSSGWSVAVRVGNTAEPGEGWTDWITVPNAAGSAGGEGGRAPDLPRARYAQVRAEADPRNAASAAIAALIVNYRGTNRSPQIDSVDVLPVGVAYRAIPPSQLTSGELPVVPAPRTPELEKALGEVNPVWRSKKAFEPGAVTLTWQASDPDNDPLRYRIESCPVSTSDCVEWTELARGVESSFYSFDSRWLSDGAYRFRVTADDGATNPSGERRESSAISEEVSIDHRPPEIVDAEVVRQADGQLTLAFTALDLGGRLARAEAAATPGEWQPLVPQDGVDDGVSENYRATMSGSGGDWVVEVRAIDTQGNVTTQRIPIKNRP